MRPKLVLALVVFGLSSVLTQRLFAAQALAVAGNGKWDMEYAAYGNVKAVAAKAIAACKAKGGTDPKIVWSRALNYFYIGGAGRGIPKGNLVRIAHGAIAISDNGTGNIVGWSFNHRYHNQKRALDECRRKGGQNPKVVATF
jgi:hypothetical protein